MAEVDKFGDPIFYRRKPGGFMYELTDNPKSDKVFDWPSAMNFLGGGIVQMNPSGPTDFGIGKNISSFKDSIGGCKMDFKATASRGYAFKADDVRDLILKARINSNLSSGHGLSFSACTGHHTGSGCCQGFAYMITIEVDLNPSSFTFRKETVHVEYSDSPEGNFTHSKCNFKINGHGWVGIAFVRYNAADDKSVFLEVWFNPDPDSNPDDWTRLKKIEDKPGNHWTGSAGACNGDKDQIGTWSGAQNRIKSNASGGNVKVKALSFIEIDPFNRFPDTGGGGGGGGNVPPPPPSSTGTIAKKIRDIFNINTSAAQSCSGLPAGVQPFEVKYDEHAGTSTRVLGDFAAESHRTRVAVYIKDTSILKGIKPRQLGIPIRANGSPSGNIRGVIWDEKDAEVVELGTIAANTLTTSFVEKLFYNEGAPFLMPLGLKKDWKIGIEWLGTSSTNNMSVEYNGNNPIDGSNTVYAAWQLATSTATSNTWNLFGSRDLTCKIYV